MTKGLGEKVLGWFIVQEGDQVEERDAPSAAPASPPPGPPPGPPPAPRAPVVAPIVAPVVTHGGTHDARAFASVYRAAGVSDEERDRLTKILALLDSLPAEATTSVRRAIVGASLEAFGVSIDRILVTGEGALAALDGYVVSGQDRTREVLAQAEVRIAKLTSEIEEVRRLMDVQNLAQHELVRATTVEKARVRAVVDFFDEGRSGRAVAPPRLVRLK